MLALTVEDCAVSGCNSKDAPVVDVSWFQLVAVIVGASDKVGSCYSEVDVGLGWSYCWVLSYFQKVENSVVMWLLLKRRR